ncbi:MAG: DUF2442 domain-containing protein [Rudaea sp.]
MNKPPLIRSAGAVGPTTLEIVWSTGETLSVDVGRLLKRFSMYEPLRNARAFRKARVDGWGHAITWPGDIDMGADALYELARKQAGEWGPETFDAWMQRNGLSLSGAADALDMTRRMIAHYRTGSRPIPRVVALACEGWEGRHRSRAA